MSFRIATYNIHRCIGTDGLEMPERTARVLQELDADVVALQEVSHRPDKPGNVLDRLADAIDASAIEGKTMEDRNGHYGNAVLTRVPVSSIHRADISAVNRERRGVLDVTLSVGDHTVKIVATHLGLRSGERKQQVKRILSMVVPNPTDITVLLGDLNMWHRWDRNLRRLHRAFDPQPAPATYPSRLPLLSLDRLWIRPRNKLLAVDAHRSGLARLASDHLPLVADIDI